MGDVFGDLFGSDPEQVKQPTGFQTLPGFARDAFESSVGRAGELSQQPGLFGPSPLTSQQQQAIGQISGLSNAFTPQGFQQQLSTFQNPFTENVIGGVQRDIGEGLSNQLADVSSLASQQGAFGGTRQATTEAQLRARALEDLGDTTSRLRSQGFESAVNNALRGIGAQSGLSNNLFNIGSQLQQQQTARQQAPIGAVNFLSNIAGAVPGGGGGIGFGPGSVGALNRLGDTAGRLGSGFGELGSTIGGFMGGF